MAAISSRSLDSVDDRRRSRSQVLKVELIELNADALLSRGLIASTDGLYEDISGGEPDILPGRTWP